mgnify:CR=1 FL=1
MERHKCDKNCDLKSHANALVYRLKVLKDLQEEIAVLESKLMNHMLENKQTQMQLTNGDLVLKQVKVGMAEVFQQKFGELDKISKEQFDDIFTPETQKTVPAKISLQKLNKLKKYGADIWGIAEECIDTKSYNLKYLEKK